MVRIYLSGRDPGNPQTKSKPKRVKFQLGAAFVAKFGKACYKIG